MIFPELESLFRAAKPDNQTPTFEEDLHNNEKCTIEHGHIAVGDFRGVMTTRRYCRLATPCADGTTGYSALIFEVCGRTVVDSTFIYNLTTSRRRFDRFMRIARREKLDCDQMITLAEDMSAAGLL